LIHSLNAAEDVKLPSGIVLKYHVFKQRLGEDMCCFLVQPPAPGYYKLDIFGKKIVDSKSSSSEYLLSILVSALSLPINMQIPPFPIHDGYWGPNVSSDKLKLEFPDLDGAKIITDSQTGLAKLSIKCGVEVELIHGLNEAEDVRLPSGIVLKEHVFKQHLGEDTCCFLVRPPAPGYYKLSIFGKQRDDPQKSLHYVMSVLVSAFSLPIGINIPKSFPTTFGTWARGCHLLQPLDGVLKRKTSYKCSLFCPQAQAVMVQAENKTYDMESILATSTSFASIPG
jgi:hypothetical protein